MLYEILLFVNIFNFIYQSPTNVQNLNQINARLQCQLKEKDEISLMLDCTLTNSGDGVQISTGDTQTSSVQSLNVRVGLDENWRTPWESLSINPFIIRGIIWRESKLTEIGEYTFKDLKYLRQIDLSHNKLSQLKASLFSNFEVDVIDLDLSFNQFQQVPNELFESSKLQSLEALRLNENPITQLTKKSFDKIRSRIVTIELNNCKIRSIEPGTFDQMKSLDSLSLVGNHIRTLNYHTFEKLTLHSFYVHDNPFNCDCHLRWLIDFIKNVEYNQQIYGQEALGVKQAYSDVVYVSEMSVMTAAQKYLRCDQPNSLKSKRNFLDINPDSFMCDIEIDFRDEIREAVYELGDDALLICDVYGDPEPDVYWSFGQKPIGKSLKNDIDKYYVNDIRIMPNTMSNFNSITNKTSELRIKNLQSSDFGVYTCTAEIKGSNNRKQIGFSVKQFKSGPVGTLSSAGDFITNRFKQFLGDFKSKYFQNLSSVSNSSIAILFSILISVFLFVTFVFVFICWKCFCKKKKIYEKKLIYNPGTLSKEKEAVKLINHSNDCLDSQNSQQNYSHLANDSSATLISNNKISNSIRMAYPNYNDIYANHSLLTTTSTTTGSTYPTNHIAIDTSNQMPKYHLLPQQNLDSYYDDLRYNNEDNSSPYRQQASYSPIVRRDDPTVPLYATLKPKGNPQHQRQYSSNYAQYTLQRSTPPLPAPRRGNSYFSGQQLPPPPPPPMPPVKPKRTFEYSKDLQSESGALLLAEEKSEFDQSDCDVNYQTYKRIKRKPTKANLQKVVKANPMPNSSTTSLDEDLDLNDLKDFEDVTFDNLRKPNENDNTGTARFKQHMSIKKNQLMILQQGIKKNLLEAAQSNNSEQSLLLKSSSSSSDKSSSNTNLNPSNESPNTVITNSSENDKDKIFENVDDDYDDEKNKIYEETEI